MNLYELASNVLEAFETGFSVDAETGEVTFSPEAIEAVGNFEEKLEACLAVIKDETATAKAIKAEEQALSLRRKAHENRAARLKEYTLQCLESVGYQGFECPRGRLSTRRTKAVEVDSEKVPAAFKTVETVEKVDKRAIRDAIEQGEDVPGAFLVENVSLIVR